jgi:hypothetical protein
MNLNVVDIKQHVHHMEVQLFKALNGELIKDNIGLIVIFEKEEILMDIKLIHPQRLSEFNYFQKQKQIFILVNTSFASNFVFI